MTPFAESAGVVGEAQEGKPGFFMRELVFTAARGSGDGGKYLL